MFRSSAIDPVATRLEEGIIRCYSDRREPNDGTFSTMVAINGGQQGFGLRHGEQSFSFLITPRDLWCGLKTLHDQGA